jgi:hypothetical protein
VSQYLYWQKDNAWRKKLLDFTLNYDLMRKLQYPLSMSDALKPKAWEICFASLSWDCRDSEVIFQVPISGEPDVKDV